MDERSGRGDDRTTPAGRLDQGTVVSGHYRIERLLGRGGMGEVYLAEDTRLGRRVALKFLSAELAREDGQRRRFLSEARVASSLSHPNVCVIYEVAKTEQAQPFIAMEYLEGEGLDSRLRRGLPPISETIEIARQLVEALEAAHAAGIVHRDIKPANICLSKGARVKVLDFGLAKQLGSADVDADGSTVNADTRPGTLLGTPGYMSPEQALSRPVDHRADLFSVGAVLYELVTGRQPFPGKGLAEVLEKIVHAHPEAMARFNYDVPPELDRITRKCLAKDPEVRYQSARELLIDLKTLGAELAAGRDERAAGMEATVIVESPSNPLATSPSGDEIRQSDILITYADIDDQPVIAGRRGWISQFHRNLELRVAQLSGENVRIWRQPDPAGRVEVLERIEPHVPEVKTCVSIVSPPFIKSEGCRRIVEKFWRSAMEAGALQVDNRSRLFKVVKTPVEQEEMPRELAPLFAELAAYEFFERDAETGRLREFDEAFGDAAKRRFFERVYDVAFEIVQVLRHLAAGRPAAGRANGKQKTIFVATTTSDVDAQRDQLRRELLELGHKVLPSSPLPLVASELTSVVSSCLDECDFAIHPVGQHYGLVPEATDLSMVALQNLVAAEKSATTGLERVVWMPKGLSPRDERQGEFLRELTRNPDLHRGAEVISDTLENLKVLLATRWKRQALEAESPLDIGTSGPLRVYLVCDKRDEEAIEPLEDFFYDQGIEVSLPGFEATESEAQEIHLRNLQHCDAALIYYGHAGNHWVDFNVQDLMKAAGYRGGDPITVSAIFLAPPFNRRKERFKSLSTEVLRQEEQFDPKVLQEFIHRVTQIKRR